MEDKEEERGNMNIEELKKKYEYDANNFFGYDDIWIKINAKCCAGIEGLKYKIKRFMEKLKNYNGEKKDEKKNYLERMDESLKYWQKLEIELMDDTFYYNKIISCNYFNYEQYESIIPDIQEICKKTCKSILDSRIELYIKYDKKIINILNQIDSFNKYFQF